MFRQFSIASKLYVNSGSEAHPYTAQIDSLTPSLEFCFGRVEEQIYSYCLLKLSAISPKNINLQSVGFIFFGFHQDTASAKITLATAN